jgi:hypothetical protein
MEKNPETTGGFKEQQKALEDLKDQSKQVKVAEPAPTPRLPSRLPPRR